MLYLALMGFYINSSDKNSLVIAALLIQYNLGLTITGTVNDETFSTIQDLYNCGAIAEHIVGELGLTTPDQTNNGNKDRNNMAKIYAANGSEVYLSRETAVAWAYLVTAVLQDSESSLPISLFYPGGADSAYRDFARQQYWRNYWTQRVTNAFNNENAQGRDLVIRNRVETAINNLMRQNRRLSRAQATELAIAQVTRVYSANPGFSNHGFGNAIDFGFSEGSPEHIWMQENASTFGFRPYAAEHWHWDYNP